MTEALRKQQPLPPPTDLLPEKAQREASDPRHSVWVSASAGSGKTTVLTARVLRLLLDGVKPERILCLTFTRAAAAQMAIRVTERLGVWATCDLNVLRAELDKIQGTAPTPEQLAIAKRLLNRVLNCPGGLRIRTIHAFAQEILRRFPIEAGLPPHFKVIEERDAAELRNEAMRGLMREAVSPESTSPRTLKTLLATLGESGLRDALDSIMKNRAQLIAAAASAGGAEKLTAKIRAQLSLKPGDTADSIRAATLKAVPEADIRDAAKKLCEGSASFAERGRGMLEWLALDANQRIAKFDDYCRFFLTGAGEVFAKFANKDLLNQHPDIDTVLRREAERLIPVRAHLEALEISESTGALVTLGLDLAARMDALKSARAALDYDDLILRADNLLRREGIAPWVLYKLDGGLDHILVDEAQDTSAAQWRIVAALADEFFAGASARSDQNRTLFVVGDEKQSIFSFQHADPEAFAAMKAAFAKRLKAIGKQLHEEQLNFSFRSAPAVLRAVDQVFALDEARAGVSNDLIQHFPAPRQSKDLPKVGHIELWPLIKAPEKEDREAWELPREYNLERDREAELASNIASKIKNFITAGEKLPGHAASIAPGDIMILLRRRGRFADLMVRALKSANVPVTGVDRMHLVKQLPVMDLLALLQFALLPEDDLNLASLLRSPLLGVSEDDLMQLCLGRKGSLWQALKDQAVHYGPAHDYLTGILAQADFTTPFAFLSAALNEPCPGSTISGRRALWGRLGMDALDPIEELLSAALEFDLSHPPSLQEFLRWLTSADTEVKRELDQGEKGQVRIMTVHASKGLEAPIVFLPDAAGLPRAQDVPEILWHDSDEQSETGISTPFYLPRKPTSNLPRELWDEARQKQMEEYRRLFYVALTRASHRLYIAGWETRGEGGGERLRPAGAQSETGIRPASWHTLAEKALKPLHEPHAIPRDATMEILAAFSDIYIGDTAPAAEKTKATQKQNLPAWATAPAQTEAAAPRPLSPSALAAPPLSKTPEAVFARGRIIHRLLQSLPDVAVNDRTRIAARFLANPVHQLSAAQQKEIADEVLKIINAADYAPLFGPGSRAEIPVVGHIDGRLVPGQVDRLCVREKDIWIVDYKTGTPPADAGGIPEAYRAQLASYAALLRQIYPGKAIRCFLLWTAGPKLMEVVF
jgi:ATP-dependent helicase/nuclease subunit A